MSVNRTISGVLLCALLAACNAPAAPQAGPNAAQPSLAPNASGAQRPAATPRPTPTVSVAPYVTAIASPMVKVDALSFAAGNITYTAATQENNVFRGKAALTVQVDAQPPVTLEVEEFDAPDNDQGDKTFDTLTFKDPTTNNVRTFGADQGFVSFWVSDKAAGAGGYKVLQAEGNATAGLWVRWVSGETFYISNRADTDTFIAYSVEAAAKELLRMQNGQPVWPQIHGASIASLSGLFATMREKPAGAPPALSLRTIATRYPAKPDIKEIVKGSGFGRYELLAEEETTLHPAMALLREIIAQRKGTPTP